MKNIGIKLAIIYLVLGCHSKPEGLISEKDMSNIISDLKIIEVKLDNLYFQKMDSSRVAYGYLQNKVFEKYKTDSVSYSLSYDYYLQNRAKMVKIYENAAETLTDTTVILPKLEID